MNERGQPNFHREGKHVFCILSKKSGSMAIGVPSNAVWGKMALAATLRQAEAVAWKDWR
jgi:hypothetical protein